MYLCENYALAVLQTLISPLYLSFARYVVAPAAVANVLIQSLTQGRVKGVKQAHLSQKQAQNDPYRRSIFGYFPAANCPIGDRFIRQGKPHLTILFIQNGLALWVIYGFHRGASNNLPINIDERCCWIKVVSDICRSGRKIASIIN